MGHDGGEKESLRPDIIGALIIAGVMILCIAAALTLSPTFSDMGFQAFGEEEASNPIWAFFYIGLVIVMAVVIILLIKYGFQKFIHIAFLGAVFFTIVFVLTPMITIIMAEEPTWESEDDQSLFPPPDSLPSHINGSRIDYDDGYVIWDEFGLVAYNATGLVARYYGNINTMIQTDVSGDNRSEVVIGDDTGVKVFDRNLELELAMELGMNVTSLSASKVLGQKRESLIACTEEGEVMVFIPSAGAFTAIDLSGDAGEVPGNVMGVYLEAVDDTTMTAYVLTDDGLYYMDIEFSIMPMVISGSIAAFFAGIAVILLLIYPEWYVVDITGVVLAVGALTLIGISLSILPLFILLTFLAVYDAIAVYRTKHMITMASTIVEMRLPVLLVIPKSLNYTFRDQETLKKQLDKKEARGALFIGLGDIIIPGTLVVSAFTFLGSSQTYFGIPANLCVSLFTLVGILVGFTFLMKFVLTGKPQAGLPLLNSGAIFGYVIGYLIIFQDLTLGFETPVFGFGF